MKERIQTELLNIGREGIATPGGIFQQETRPMGIPL
jgi:hypothetical protein